MTYRLTRDEIGPLLLHIPDQTFQRIPDTTTAFFVGGKMFNYAETIADLVGAGIVPVWCESTGDKGKRQFATLISGEEKHIYFNVEKIGNYWQRNAIEKLMPNKAYFVYFEPDNTIIKSVIMIGAPGLSPGV